MCLKSHLHIVDKKLLMGEWTIGLLWPSPFFFLFFVWSPAALWNSLKMKCNPTNKKIVALHIIYRLAPVNMIHPFLYKTCCCTLLVSAGYLCDLSILFMWIQNLVTILDICASQKRRHKNDVTYVETGVCRQHYSMINHLIYSVNTSSTTWRSYRVYYGRSYWLVKV